MAVLIAPTRGPIRLLRGSVAAAAATILGAIGHVAAGGAHAPVGLLLVFGVLLAVVFVGLADERRSTGSILAVVAASQLALHELFELVGTHEAGTNSVAAPGVNPLWMLCAHAAATVVVAWLLGSAERTVFAVAAALARVVPRRPTPMFDWRPLPAAPVGERVTDHVLDVLLSRIHLRRGPPVRA